MWPFVFSGILICVGYLWGLYDMQHAGIIKSVNTFKHGDIVWVPRVSLALWSRPGSKFTEDLWNVGIIIDIDTDGNTKLYVNGEYEYLHTNFIRPMDRCVRLHPEG